MHNNALKIFVVLILDFAFAACATTGENYAELAAQGVDMFAGKNWNAPRRNNMYDRWEFNANGAFHFWHIHHGEPLDRGLYRYEVKDGIITIAKEGDEDHRHYRCVFSGKTVTLTPVEHQGEKHEAEEHDGGSGVLVEHASSKEQRQMGALPEAPVTFTLAR